MKKESTVANIKEQRVSSSAAKSDYNGDFFHAKLASVSQELPGPFALDAIGTCMKGELLSEGKHVKLYELRETAIVLGVEHVGILRSKHNGLL